MLWRIFQLLAPAAEVVRFSFDDLPRFATKEALFRELAPFDFIFAQPFGTGFHPAVDGLVLKERFRDSFHFYPAIEFNAFHPDCVYVRNLQGFARSAIGDYHSAITLLGYSLGLSVEQTLTLFRAEVFERLGYFRYWKVSEDVLFKLGRAIDFPIEGIYRSWVRRCPFMHSINHPRLFVLADVARTLLHLSGISAVSGNVEDFLPDEALYDPVWPIYPEIAEAMGFQGAYIFKVGSRSEYNPFLTLPDFVARSWELYQKETSPLECSRIAEWTRNAPLIDAIRRFVNPVSRQPPKP
ncbi:MAG: hypothetical protein LAP87_07990 [Acidobacteriia bacterium]|nr:hypothetical protein [Terriglobia bacterium]